MKIQVLHTFKSHIAEASIVLVVLYAFYDRFKINTNRVWVNTALLILALLSVGAYFDFGHYAKIPFYINRHDFFHYYMGAKYSREIGYLHLYPSSIIVDSENDPQYKPKSVRDQENYRHYPLVKNIIKEKDFYKKKLFTQDRWKEFEKDTLYFRQLMGAARWQRALRDKGYNATPTWNMVGRLLTNSVPTDNDAAMLFLRMLDPALIVIMFLTVWLAFGWRVTLLGIIFFGTNFMMNQTHIKGSLLRLDWVTMMVMAISFIKLKYYKTAGLLMGYATMARIFPVIFLFGMGAKFLFDLKKTKKINPQYLSFFIAFTIMISALFTTSIVADGGIDTWKTYMSLITMHNDDVVEVRVGFKYIFLGTTKKTEGMTLNQFKDDKNKKFHDYAPLWWCIQGAVLLLSLFCVKDLEDYETIPYGFVPAYFLIGPTFYYYVMLIIPVFLFTPKLENLHRAIGISAMFAISIAGYFLFKFMNLNYPLFYWNSLMYLGFVIFIMVISLQTKPQKQNPSRAT